MKAAREHGAWRIMKFPLLSAYVIQKREQKFMDVLQIDNRYPLYFRLPQTWLGCVRHWIKRVKILASQKRIVYQPTNSFYQLLSAEAYSKHGFKDMSPPTKELMKLT